MSGIIDSIDTFLGDYFDLGLPDIQVTDVVEIIIIAWFIYYVLAWIKDTRAWMLFRGILIIIVFFLAAAVFQMNTILWLGEKLVSAGLIALIVVFQPELRSALERLGRSNLLNHFLPFAAGRPTGLRFSDRTLNDLVKACFEMGAVKTGALIVIEQDVQMTEYERTGIPLDALVTKQLLINIFEKNTPLHDGAIIVRGNRVVAATCYLPLTDSMMLSKDLGTRHRAAVGASEVSDALIIVVSEETGKVSVAKESRLIRDVSPEGLTDILKHLQDPEMKYKKGESVLARLGRRIRHEK
ncbi:MAG: diadenylate cyclase CdaA [Lachnospiraceae bacterium]|nr:diadenylate cyclase CdaA [Lachnospiraceae bacterium]